MKYLILIVSLCISGGIAGATHDGGAGPIVPPLLPSRVLTILPPLASNSAGPRLQPPPAIGALSPDMMLTPARVGEEVIESHGAIVRGNVMSVAPGLSPLFGALPQPREGAVLRSPPEAWQPGNSVIAQAREALSHNAKAAVWYNGVGERGYFVIDHASTALSYLALGGVFVCGQMGIITPVPYLAVAGAMCQSLQIFAAARRNEMRQNNVALANSGSQGSVADAPASGAAIAAGQPALLMQP